MQSRNNDRAQTSNTSLCRTHAICREKERLLTLFASETVIHAVDWAILAEKKWVRAFWVTVLLLATTGCVYQTIQVIKEFLEEQPATVYQVVNKNNLTVPPLDICPTSRFGLAQLKQEGILGNAKMLDLLHLSFVNAIIPQLGSVALSDYYNDPEAAVATLTNAEAALNGTLQHRNETLDQYIDRIGLDCRGIVSNCYAVAVIKGANACCQESMPVATPFGRCFRIPAVEQVQPGVGQGHFVEIRMKGDSENTAGNAVYMPYLGEGIRPPVDGVVFRVIPQNSDPIMGFAPRFQRSSVTLRLTEGVFLSTKGNPCKSMGQNDEPAHVCKSRCYYTAMFENCPCKPYGLPEGVSAGNELCSPLSLLRCYQTAAKRSDLEERYLACAKSCKDYCRVTQYSAISTHAQYTDRIKMKGGSNQSVIAEDAAKIDVHFQTLEMIQIKQFPRISPANLAGQVGGLLGLWLGGSILGVVHLVCFWVMHANDKKQIQKLNTITAE